MKLESPTTEDYNPDLHIVCKVVWSTKRTKQTKLPTHNRVFTVISVQLLDLQTRSKPVSMPLHSYSQLYVGIEIFNSMSRNCRLKLDCLGTGSRLRRKIVTRFRSA